MLHPRNKNIGKYDLSALASSFPELKNHTSFAKQVRGKGQSISRIRSLLRHLK